VELTNGARRRSSPRAMATVLIEFSHNRREVIPFIVCDGVEGAMKTSQVKFMIDQGWLTKENVLHWDEVDTVNA